MISLNARSIILELIDHDSTRLHPNFDRDNDNDLSYFVFQFLGGIEQFEIDNGVEFYQKLG